MLAITKPWIRLHGHIIILYFLLIAAYSESGLGVCDPSQQSLDERQEYTPDGSQVHHRTHIVHTHSLTHDFGEYLPKQEIYEQILQP